MVEDPANGERLGEECEHGSLAAAVCAGEHVDEVDASEEIGPGEAARCAGFGFWFGGGVGWRSLGAGLRVGAFGVVGRSWHDAIAERRGWGEHAVVGDQVGARSRHQSGESRDEVERIEDDVGGPVAELALQLVDDLGAASGEGEALVYEWRPGGVPAEGFELVPAVVGDEYAGVRGKPFGIGAELAAAVLRAALGAAPDALGGSSSVRPEGLLTLHGSGGEGGEQRRVVEVVVLARVFGRKGAAFAQEAEDAMAERLGELLDVGVSRAFVRMELCRGCPRRAGEGAVRPEGVEVEVEPEGGVEALGHGDAAGARVLDAALSGAGAVERLDRADEDPAHPGAELRVEGAQVTDAVGEGEHPLAGRGPREHSVGEPGRRVVHAACAAGNAWRTRLAPRASRCGTTWC